MSTSPRRMRKDATVDPETTILPNRSGVVCEIITPDQWPHPPICLHNYSICMISTNIIGFLIDACFALLINGSKCTSTTIHPSSPSLAKDAVRLWLYLQMRWWSVGVVAVRSINCFNYTEASNCRFGFYTFTYVSFLFSVSLSLHFKHNHYSLLNVGCAGTLAHYLFRASNFFPRCSTNNRQLLRIFHNHRI